MRKDAMLFAFFVTALSLPLTTPAQTAAASSAQAATAIPRQSGTVKAVTPRDFVLTNGAGQDFAVIVSPGTRILLVDPGTRDLKTARPGTMSDLAGGDKAIVTGTAGDSGQSLSATRILLLKSGAIAAMHAEQQAEWAHSLGGLVRSVDQAVGTITAVNGSRMLTIKTTPATTFRRYAAGSVRFEDAAKSSLAAIEPGDQVQARGQHTADGLAITADEVVSGSFMNVSGKVTAVDTASGTVTLTDLATKHAVTVTVTPQTSLRRLPADFKSGMGSRPGANTTPAGSAPAHPGASADSGRGTPGETGSSRSGSSRLDLARIAAHLPTESLADLKPGDAVILVASRSSAGGDPVAISLVSGVEQILAASPSGETTLSPWSLGSGEGEGSGEGADAGAR